MSNWRSESGYLGRYAGSGMLNTAVGLAVIFLLMALGVAPLIANIGGYLVGFMLGFVVSKRFVFRSAGSYLPESMRYLAAFLLSFGLNLLVLQVLLNTFHWNATLATLTGVCVYTGTMYLLTRWVVFHAGMKNSPPLEK